MAQSISLMTFCVIIDKVTDFVLSNVCGALFRLPDYESLGLGSNSSRDRKQQVTSCAKLTHFCLEVNRLILYNCAGHHPFPAGRR